MVEISIVLSSLLDFSISVHCLYFLHSLFTVRIFLHSRSSCYLYFFTTSGACTRRATTEQDFNTPTSVSMCNVYFRDRILDSHDGSRPKGWILSFVSSKQDTVPYRKPGSTRTSDKNIYFNITVFRYG